MLDGVHRLLGSSLAMIQSLITDREISLFDGTHLVPGHRFDHMVDVLYEKEATAETTSTFVCVCVCVCANPLNNSSKRLGIHENSVEF